MNDLCVNYTQKILNNKMFKELSCSTGDIKLKNLTFVLTSWDILYLSSIMQFFDKYDFHKLRLK